VFNTLLPSPALYTEGIVAVGQEEASRCPRKAVLATSDAHRQMVSDPIVFMMREYSTF